MAYADALIAVWDGVSPGTKDMIRQVTKAQALECARYFAMENFHLCCRLANAKTEVSGLKFWQKVLEQRLRAARKAKR